MKYSIITPIHLWDDRTVNLFQKCVDSVNNLNYEKTNFEHLVINDGSILPFDNLSSPHIRVINQANLQRITAYNNGFKEAKGDIFLLLDGDDELVPDALNMVDKAFQSNLKYKMFNFGCTFVHKDGVEVQRDPFMPKEEEVGHEIFGGGNIVNGTFVFSREIYDDLGAFMPEVAKDMDCTELNYPAHSEQEPPFIRELRATSPYDFSAYMQLKYPEIQKFFMVKHPDHPKLLVRELGNPYGQDYALFYIYTRKYKSKPVKEYILRVNLK